MAAAASSAGDIFATALVSFFRPLFEPVDEALSRLLVPSRSAYPHLKSSLLLRRSRLSSPSSPSSSSSSPASSSPAETSPREPQQQPPHHHHTHPPSRESSNDNDDDGPPSLSLPPAAVVVAAVLLNHVRRVLVPWLGQFVWRHPIEAMKLARSSPCYLLEGSVGEGFDWAAVLGWGLRVRVLGAVREVLMRRMRRVGGLRSRRRGEKAGDAVEEKSGGVVASGGHDEGRAGEGTGFGETHHHGGSRDGMPAGAMVVVEQGSRADEMLFDVCRIVYLATSMAILEGAYAESCWAAAHIYALVRTTTPPPRLLPSPLLALIPTGLLLPLNTADAAAARAYVLDALASHRLASIFQACLLAHWAVATLLPTTAWVVVAAVRGALRGSGGDVYTPAAAYALWAGTALLVRKSNKYFIVLEMSEMLVTFGWLALGLGVLAVWTVEVLAARRERKEGADERAAWSQGARY
ncbi:hypothetical protein JDV02_002516 [Purpureocillium takamizusanense]|uniref:Uncharacterized protein n=1 Tax=Purpureocillium takamizusanense TaxID=2060973 RepID=A0A9Q8V7I2_9HYPO|nr:uncharacterized protein JDV02_002516 [Purpureocillium takamizusanense]UNI16040.1 hypothetical protein JDV02_002516 [Purpureocillium takamizusanense]